MQLLSEACTDMRHNLLETQSQVRQLGGTSPDLDNFSKLEDQISRERQLREASCAELVHKVQSLKNDAVELKEDISSKFWDWPGKARTVNQEISVKFDALKAIRGDEKSSRETDLSTPERSTMKDSTGCTAAEVQRLVADLCSKERAQAKTLLSRAKQILDSDEALRERLGEVLQCEMVSKPEFLEEIARLWQRVNSETYPSTSSIQQQVVSSTPSIGSIVSPRGHEGIVRRESVGARRDGRGASPPVQPSRAIASPVLATQTPRLRQGVVSRIAQ